MDRRRRSLISVAISDFIINSFSDGTLTENFDQLKINIFQG